MSDLETQRWRDRESLEAQRRALAAFDRVYGDVARFLEAFLELAG